MKTRMDAIRRKAIAWVTMTSMILAMAVHFGAPVMAGMAGGTWLDEFAPGDLMYADFDWYDEADGTELDPYILSTAADFAGLAYVVNSGGAGAYDENSFAGEYFKVADGAVIDFTGHTWISIGTADYPFSGNFDGNNITLTGITVNNGAIGNFGFFGYVKSQGDLQCIENIVLEEPSVTGRFRLGALIGSIESTTALTLSNCHVNGGAISATDANSGGLVGEIIADAPLTLENCSSGADLMGQANTGGLVGRLEKFSFGADIEIRGCHTTGRIVGSVQTGGLIGLIYNNAEYGENTPILIENCYTTGDVLADGGQAGGLIGYADNGNLGVEIMVSRCYSTGDIFGAEGAGTDFGGLIGQIFAGGGGTNQISNCYAMGNAEGYRAVGGLIGTVSMWGNTTLDIINGYATGNAKAYDTSSDGYVGGIIGKYNTNSAPMSALNLSNMLALNASVTGGAGSYHRILGGQVNANGTMTGEANRAFEEMLLGVTDSGSYASISSADSTGTEGGDVDRASVNDSALTESYFDVVASAGAWTFSDMALPKLGLADAGIPMPQHLRLPGPEILVVSDFTAMVGATVRVTVGEDGMLYLVPKAAYADQDALDAVSDNQYIAACTANTSASLETGSLDPGIYQIYAVNSAGSLSDPSPDIILSSGAGGLSASAGSTDYYLSGPAVVIDAGLAMTGFGADNIDQASVMIRNKLSGDLLTYPEPIGAITGSYNASTGILTLSGTDTPANYQSALRSVKFSTTSDSLTARIIDFSVGGGLFYEGTGHFYEYVDHGGSITWGAAKTAAESKGLFGREGYLVTIGSEGENTFVQSKTAGLGWIGAEDVNHPDGSGASSGDWRWVSGPEGLADSGAGFAFWSGFAAGTAVNGAYARWAGSEPNNHMNTEYAAHVYGPDSDNPGYWNDFSPSNASAMGYIVEYGGMPDDTPLNVIGTKSVDVARYYNVSYSGNGSTGGTAPTDAESYLTDDTVTVLGNTGSLVRTGYTFDGWNTAANGSGTAYSGGGTFAMGSSNVTLYAQWAPVDYTVTYNGNGNTGGAVPTDGNTYNITDTVTVLGNTGSLVRTGYTFDGWDTAADGSGTAYSGADTFAMGSSNVTLYAQWAPVDYTVTYDGNGNTGGTVPVDAGLYNITDTVTVLGNTGSLVRTGFTFDGWDTAANGSGTAYSGADTFAMGSSNVTLYAQWRRQSSGSGGTPQTEEKPVMVIVNGNEQNAGTETKTVRSGVTTVVVTVDNTVIDSKIDEAIKNNPGGAGNGVEIPVTDTDSPAASVALTGDIVKKLEQNAFDVSVRRDNVAYVIPAQEFNISNTAQRLGVSETELQDIKVEVNIRNLDEAVVEKYREVADANGAELIFPPVAFEVVAETVNADGTTSRLPVDRFTNYVQRVMEIPAGVDPSKVTTGIVFNADGTYSHVPTEVYQENGKWYARLNSLTNSEYSVVWNPVTVASVENHWSKDAVNDMASRLIIVDADNFVPNQAITRAGFADYIVRALGLYREGGAPEVSFADVNDTEVSALAIKIASANGIVTGYPDGTFKPAQKITREEAMVMYVRAMGITKLLGSDALRYQQYADYQSVGAWAQASVKEVLAAHVFNGISATRLSPKSNLTCAEAAQAIRNLLVESGLINS